jgi:hypothetical protein
MHCAVALLKQQSRTPCRSGVQGCKVSRVLEGRGGPPVRGQSQMPETRNGRMSRSQLDFDGASEKQPRSESARAKVTGVGSARLRGNTSVITWMFTGLYGRMCIFETEMTWSAAEATLKCEQIRTSLRSVAAAPRNRWRRSSSWF